MKTRVPDNTIPMLGPMTRELCEKTCRIMLGRDFTGISLTIGKDTSVLAVACVKSIRKDCGEEIWTSQGDTVSEALALLICELYLHCKKRKVKP